MKRLALVTMVGLAGCVSKVTADDNERGPIAPPPVAEFDPASSIIPFPNDLLLNPATGKLALPPQCGETPQTTALRTGVLNSLDGFGTSKTNLQATFSQPVDASSLAGRVFLLRLTTAGVVVDRSEVPVPIVATPGTSVRFSADCRTSSPVNNVTIVPQVPLDGSSTYGVALLQGITTTSGATFQPTATWALVRQVSDPVQFSGSMVTENLTPFDPQKSADLTTLMGIDQLWKAHAALLTFLDASLPETDITGRDRILLAWSFNTQTIAPPFQANVVGSPASLLTSPSAPDSLQIAQSVPAAAVESFYTAHLGAGSCALLGCGAIGAIYTGGYLSPNFQTLDDCDPSTPTPPGAWSDPIKPTPVCNQTVPFLAVVPQAPPAASGYRTVIFAHGLGRSKGDLLAIAGPLAAQGIASIAIDAVDHGDRAVRLSTDATIGCAAPAVGNTCTTAIDATCAPQCFAPILSADLAATRDNLRQTVLDTLKLERVLATCAAQGACQGLQVDPAHTGYLGQSLGSLLGGVTVAVSPDIKTAVLNVGSADWLQILTLTQSLQIRCSLLDGLIDGGVLTGEKSNLGTNPNALCLDPHAAWRQDPRFLSFAMTARWVLDPADPINYAQVFPTPTGPRVLLQEVLSDEVLPNEATDPYGALLGLMRTPAAVAVAIPPTPTPIVGTAGSSWVLYSTVPGDAALSFPGNSYRHGSLLVPATADAAGQLGTAQMQTDAITFLVTHL